MSERDEINELKAHLAGAREALGEVRVLICEATDPRTRDPLLVTAIREIDASLAIKGGQ